MTYNLQVELENVREQLRDSRREARGLENTLKAVSAGADVLRQEKELLNKRVEAWEGMNRLDDQQMEEFRGLKIQLEAARAQRDSRGRLLGECEYVLGCVQAQRDGYEKELAEKDQTIIAIRCERNQFEHGNCELQQKLMAVSAHADALHREVDKYEKKASTVQFDLDEAKHKIDSFRRELLESQNEAIVARADADVYKQERDALRKTAGIRLEDCKRLVKERDQAQRQADVWERENRDLRQEVESLGRARLLAESTRERAVVDSRGADARALDVLAREYKLRAALKKIEAWGPFPEAVHHDGTPCSYAEAWGSNGERDYMRKVAREALTGVEAVEPKERWYIRRDRQQGGGVEWVESLESVYHADDPTALRPIWVSTRDAAIWWKTQQEAREVIKLMEGCSGFVTTEGVPEVTA